MRAPQLDLRILRLEKRHLAFGCAGMAAIVVVAFAYGLSPAGPVRGTPNLSVPADNTQFASNGAGAGAGTVAFSVGKGEGFFEVVGDLYDAGLIRSKGAFSIFALADGGARAIQPGVYALSSSMSAPSIVAALRGGARESATVVIPEGSSRYDIDAILSGAGVLQKGEFLAAAPPSLEGRLFPDTYKFFLGDDAFSVVKAMTDDFDAKAMPLLAADPAGLESNLILASLLEKEVPGAQDRKIVAGILKKRLAAGMPLQVDASVCYAKRVQNADAPRPCYPLRPIDFAIASDYNTYLHKGLPPGPIGSPGKTAILAAMSPAASPYWFYLSDPRTKETIYARTLGEQEAHQAMYLR